MKASTLCTIIVLCFVAHSKCVTSTSCPLEEPDRFLIVGGKPGHQGSYILRHVGSSADMTFEDYQDQFPWAIDNALALNLPPGSGHELGGDILLVGGYNVTQKAYFNETLVHDLSTRKWKRIASPRLEKPRDMAAIAMVDQLGWWITGGITTEDGATSSTEYIDPMNPMNFMKGPELPLPLYGHCMVSVPETAITLIIGGYHGRLEEHSGMSSDVWSFDFGEEVEPTEPKVTLLNSLNEARMKPACGILRNDDPKEIIVTVVGGFSGESLATIEVLHVNLLDLTRSIYSKWTKYDPPIPFGLHGGSLLPSPPGCANFTLLGGQNSAKGILNTVIRRAFDAPVSSGWQVDNLSQRRADFAVVNLSSCQIPNRRRRRRNV